jgi:hypothetical protein
MTPIPEPPPRPDQCSIFAHNIANMAIPVEYGPTIGSPMLNESYKLAKVARQFRLSTVRTRNYKPSRCTDPTSNADRKTSLDIGKEKLSKYLFRKKCEKENYLLEKAYLNELLTNSNKKERQAYSR